MQRNIMEDLREQQKNQDIVTVGDISLWSLKFTKSDLFDEVSANSSYFINQNKDEALKNDSFIILEDDKFLYNTYIQNAIKELIVLLSRRIPQDIADYKELFAKADVTDVITDNETILVINMIMSSNHDCNLISSLQNFCKNFLIKRVLEQWYKVDFGSEEERKNLLHILHYRRKSVARRVRPLL